MTDKLFAIEASKGFIIKTLIDVLSTPIPRGCFIFSNEGIFFCHADTELSLMFNVMFPRENFRTFTCKRKVCVSFNLKQAHGQLKNVKKKDSVTLHVYEDRPNELWMTIKQDNNSRDTLSRTESNSIPCKIEPDYTPLFDISDIIKQGQYAYPMVISASDFQKIKKMTTKGRTITIKMQDTNFLQFACDDILFSKLSFGEFLDSNTHTHTMRVLYEKKFFTCLLNTLVRLPGLCTHMQFYAPGVEGYPLRIKMNAVQGGTNLGTVEVFIKDVEQIQYEQSLKNESKDITLIKNGVKKARSKKKK